MRWPWLLPAVLAACFSDSPTTGAMCPDGANGCPCSAQDACEGELMCTDNGYCVDPNCVEGTPNCPCYGNGTCNAGYECIDEAVCHMIEGTGSDPTNASASLGTGGPDPTGSSDDAATEGRTTSNTSCECSTGHCDAQGRCARWIFVTRVAHSSNLAGQAGADELCNAEAENADLDATFVAFLHDGTTTAPDHAQTTGDEDVVFLLPGDEPIVVAASSAPFALKQNENEIDLDHPIDRDAAGDPPVASSDDCGDGMTDRVFTGYTLNTEGTLVDGGTCGGWNNSTEDDAGTGRFSEGGVGWVASMTKCGCRTGDGMGMSLQAHLYCVELP
jgi:hypothetical protein